MSPGAADQSPFGHLTNSEHRNFTQYPQQTPQYWPHQTNPGRSPQIPRGFHFDLRSEVGAAIKNLNGRSFETKRTCTDLQPKRWLKASLEIREHDDGGLATLSVQAIDNRILNCKPISIACTTDTIKTPQWASTSELLTALALAINNGEFETASTLFSSLRSTRLPRGKIDLIEGSITLTENFTQLIERLVVKCNEEGFNCRFVVNGTASVLTQIKRVAFDLETLASFNWHLIMERERLTKSNWHTCTIRGTSKGIDIELTAKLAGGERATFHFLACDTDESATSIAESIEHFLSDHFLVQTSTCTISKVIFEPETRFLHDALGRCSRSNVFFDPRLIAAKNIHFKDAAILNPRLENATFEQCCFTKCILNSSLANTSFADCQLADCTFYTPATQGLRIFGSKSKWHHSVAIKGELSDASISGELFRGNLLSAYNFNGIDWNTGCFVKGSYYSLTMPFGPGVAAVHRYGYHCSWWTGKTTQGPGYGGSGLEYAMAFDMRSVAPTLRRVNDQKLFSEMSRIRSFVGCDISLEQQKAQSADACFELRDLVFAMFSDHRLERFYPEALRQSEEGRFERDGDTLIEQVVFTFHGEIFVIEVYRQHSCEDFSLVVINRFGINPSPDGHPDRHAELIASTGPIRPAIADIVILLFALQAAERPTTSPGLGRTK
jgi:hypothetical protein